MSVARHEIPLDVIEPRLTSTREGLPVFIEGARRDPNNLSLLLGNALDLAAGASVVDPGSPDVARGLQLAARAGATLFAVAASEGRPVQVTLGDSAPVTFSGKVDRSLAHATRWVTAFCLGLICREMKALDALCAVPTKLLRGSSTRCPEYVYLTVDALRNLFTRAQGRDVTTSAILAAMNATDPRRDDVRAPDWTLHLDVPFLELLFFVHGNDAAEFAPRLEKALEMHRKFWSSDDGQRRSWNGFLAINLLGLAALAHERDIAFEVDSEYLPMRLVRGEAFEG